MQNRRRRPRRGTGIDIIAIENQYAPATAPGSGKSARGAIAPLGPRFVVIPHTARGYDFAPGLAVRLGAACVTAVEAVWEEEGAIVLTRSAFGGKTLMDIRPPGGRVVLTVQPGAFSAEETAPASPGVVTIRRSDASDERFRALGRTAVEAGAASLGEAEVIVAAGRGVGKKDNMELISSSLRLPALRRRPLARRLRRGMAGVRRQVGVTGKDRLARLTSLGISRHGPDVAGMKNSQTIVASTPIRGAHLQRRAHGLVEDLRAHPLLVKHVRRR